MYNTLFNNASNVRISRATFNFVNGNQYNINHNYPEPEGPRRFSAEDEWKVELYEEYDRVRTGGYKLLRTIGESPVRRSDYESYSLEEDDDSGAKRVFSISRLGNGQQDGPTLMSVGYTGRDANKVFKKDCIMFSQIKHVGVAQVHAFNDSAKPIIFFHDELIPLCHVIQKYPDCRVALLQYLAFQEALIPRDAIPPIWGHWFNLWVRPGDGMLLYGPDGPPVDAWLPSLDEVPVTAPHRNTIPPLPINLYNRQHLVEYLASWFSAGFTPSEESLNAEGYQSFPTDVHLIMLSVSSTSPHIVAECRDNGGDATWHLTIWNDHPVFLEDKRIRFQINEPPTTWVDYSFEFSLEESSQRMLSFTWLAQACHVYNRLKIPQDDWESYGYLGEVTLELRRSPIQETNSPSYRGNQDKLDFPFYLFVGPFVRFSDGFPDMLNWTSRTDIYCWSTDPNGKSAITEENRIALGLPHYVPQVKTVTRAWSLKDHEFMCDLQRAKGFDPHTTDFARSLAYPILKVVHPEQDRFEVISDDTNFACFSSGPEMTGDFMEVDSLNPNKGTLLGESPDSLSEDTVEDMDVDVKELCSRFEQFVGDVGMEVDD